MADHVLRELEAAAQIIIAPPNLITQEQRQVAEGVFLNYRKSQTPYELCRNILETSSVDYVLFETAGVIKTALIREWNKLPKEDIVSLRQYLFHYVINKPSLAPFVREKILQVIAIMVKRGEIGFNNKNRQRILDEVKDLIKCGDLPKQLLGCSIITSLMQEYALTTKSSDVGLPLEFHCSAKITFEQTEIRSILTFCNKLLSELTQNGIQEASLPLVKQLLSITEGVLFWKFIESEHDPSTGLYLSTKWQDVIFKSDMLDLFFTLYWKVRMNFQLAHYARSSLVQLASLYGTIMDSSETILQYLTTYMQNFLKLLSHIEIIDQEAIGIANIFKNLVRQYKSSALNSMPQDIIGSFMDKMTSITCLFCENAAQEESMCSDDCLYMEAFECMLETWLEAFERSDTFPEELCKNSSVQIFNKFLQCHLSPPDGTRGAGGKELNTEEINANEEDDRAKFKEQLQIIGVMARRILGHSLPLLYKLLEDRTMKLREQMQQLISHPDSLNISGTTLMESVYEDLHWLVLLAGHVLCMEYEREIPLIPLEIIMFSRSQANERSLDMNATLQLLASPQTSPNDIKGADQADHVIRLVATIFRLSEIEKSAIAANAAHHMSPELSSTIVWFFIRWSLPYLLQQEKYYSELSVTFLEAFGEDTPGALWIVNFLAEKVECNITAFKGEHALLNDTVQLLLSLAKCPDKAKCLLKTERFGNLVELATKGSYGLPQTAKRGLLRAVVEVGASIKDTNNQRQYWSQTIQPLQDQFKEIISRADFPRTFHQEDIRSQIINLLDLCIGVSQSMSAGSELLFQWIYPILNELPQLISLYHNYPQVVQLTLELFCVYTSSVIRFLAEPESIRIFEIGLNMIQAYARYNSNRLTIDPTAEEDTYQDVLLIMKLLTNLFRKQLLGYPIDPDCSQGNCQESQLSSMNVFLHGLNIVMPMITIDLLKFPSLCLQYFKMILIACNVCPEQLCSLPSPMIRTLLFSVEMGLLSFGNDITSMCFDFLSSLSKHFYNETREGKSRNEMLAPFLSLLWNLILTNQVDSDMVSEAASPLFSLICCYQEQHQQFVQNFISSQGDPDVAQRLANAFNKLTSNIKTDAHHVMAAVFNQNFRKFYNTVKGFLTVK